MKRLQDDGTYREVDPATWGTVTPLQQAKRLTDTDEFPAMGVEPKPDRTAQREASQVVIAAVMMTVAAVLGYVICYLQHFAAGGVR